MKIDWKMKEGEWRKWRERSEIIKEALENKIEMKNGRERIEKEVNTKKKNDWER